MMNFLEFASALASQLSSLAKDRATMVRFKSSRGFTSRPLQSMATVNFINLPEARHKQRRGGGAESENNRLMFMVSGFDADETTPVAKLKVELSVSVFPLKMRARTASPDKVAAVVADHINEVVASYPPNYTHE